MCVCVCTQQVLFTDRFVDGHLGSSHLLAIETNAAENIGVQVSESMPSVTVGTYL